MFYPYIAPVQRPDRLTSVKDESYHIDYAKYILSQCNNQQQQFNLAKYIINWNFYKGNQWIVNEDLEPFLKDESGDFRNRVRWCYNTIQPFVNILLGNAIQTEFSVRAYNVSAEVLNEKDEEKIKRMYAHRLLEVMPLMEEKFRDIYNMGETPEETEKNYENSYIDKDSVRINALFRRIEKSSRFDILKKEFVKNLVLAGYVQVKDEFKNGTMSFRTIDPAYGIYDVGAQLPNLADSEYAGDICMSSATDIYESVQLTKSQRQKIEDYGRNNFMNSNYINQWSLMYNINGGRIPRYYLTWKDTDARQYGYVEEPYTGLITKQLINHKSSDYTTKDLVDISKLSDDQKSKLGRGGIQNIQKEIIRYIDFIPQEIIGSEDIVFEYGILPYVENAEDEPFVSKLPYKFCTYDMRYGEMLTPLDSMLDPQRMMNRYLSMMEATMNGARLSSYFYDKNILDAGDPNAETNMLRNMNLGKPIGLDGSRYGGNIQNAVIPYNGSASLGEAKNFIDIVASVQNLQQRTTGVNEDMQGLGTGSKKLVGVQENNIARGSLMQEGFFGAIGDLYYDMYYCIANKGRKYYADHEISFIQIIGEYGVQEFKFKKNMMTHQFFVEMRRVGSAQTEIENVNNTIFQLLQIGAIGEKQFGNLWNRAEMDQVGQAVIEYSKEKADMAAAAAQDQAAAMQQEQQVNQLKAEGENNRVAMKEQGANQRQQMSDNSKLQREQLSGNNKTQQKLLELAGKVNQ